MPSNNWDTEKWKANILDWTRPGLKKVHHYVWIPAGHSQEMGKAVRERRVYTLNQAPFIGKSWKTKKNKVSSGDFSQNKMAMAFTLS